MTDHSPRIAVLATCFNRRDTTLAGLQALRLAAQGIDYTVYLVDDGSTDGTGAAIAAQFPEVRVLSGDGSLYWNGGMRKAWQQAIVDSPDYYMWWNDDLLLEPGSIAQLLRFQQAMEASHGPRVITLGKVVDPETKLVTYGGYVRVPGASRLRFCRVADDGSPCVTMNGNCVLIPARAVQDVGIHSEHYSHASGDVDYGLRASRAGYLIFQSPHVVGSTPYNFAYMAKQNRLTLSNWRFVFTHPKGIPWKDWLHFCRLHGGWMWPVNFVARYIKIIKFGAQG